MTKQKPTENKDLYERELANLVQTLLEKAKKLKSACLIAVETDEVTHLSGDLTDASPQLQEAFALLLQAAQEGAEYKTIQEQLRADLTQCKQEEALLSGKRQALTKVVQLLSRLSMPLTGEDTAAFTQALELLLRQAIDEQSGLDVVEQISPDFYWQAIGRCEEYQRILLLSQEHRP